jgi:translation initiation factor IF-2
MKVRRIPVEPAPREAVAQTRGYNNNSRNNNQRSPRVVEISDDGVIRQNSKNARDSSPQKRGGGGGATSTVEQPSGKGPGRVAGPKDKNKKYSADAKLGNREVRPKRASLKITSNRRGGGRSAEQKMGRRGSLKKRGDRAAEKEERAERRAESLKVALPATAVTVGELAELMDEKPIAVIKFMMTDLGVMANIAQSLDRETTVAVIEGFGRSLAGDDDTDEEDEIDEEDSALDVGFILEEDSPEDLEPRAPVITIMGHVDHGKTSLIDALRNTRVTAGEAGGITQHIAAYKIDHNGDPITFIDTPGHAAFSDMRSRGANITDIVVLVVAADDGVKEQTADSIACARQAGVPMIVAINKCDLPTADPNKVMGDLSSYGLLVEQLGGDILCTEISAKEGSGLDDLLNQVKLQAELLELQANPNCDASGIIVEAQMEKGLGSVATTLINRGTIRVGDVFVAGETSGKVRAIIDASDGKTRLDEAGPSSPVRIVGFDGTPAAGDNLIVAENLDVARQLAANRQRIAREKESASYQSGLMQSMSSIFSGEKRKERREMCVVVKADVQGSAEALSRSLSELILENDEAVVTIKVLVAEAGDVNKADVAIAGVTPDTTVIAFNCAANMAAMDDARARNIPIEYYNIVYDAIESVESRMQEVLSPTPDGEYVGSAIVQEVFNIGGTGNIAGSRCRDGFIKKGSNVRVMRGDKILCESRVRTLRNFKTEVDKIETGNECGIGLIDFEEFQAGDVIESYVM